MRCWFISRTLIGWRPGRWLCTSSCRFGSNSSENGTKPRWSASQNPTRKKKSNNERFWDLPINIFKILRDCQFLIFYFKNFQYSCHICNHDFIPRQTFDPIGLVFQSNFLEAFLRHRVPQAPAPFITDRHNFILNFPSKKDHTSSHTAY
jgi:hypothetical protein